MAKKEVKTNKEKKHFFRDFKAELKKVIWPTPKQLINNTAVVVALVLITALIVFVLDLCFDSANKYGVTKLQSMLQNSTSVEENESSEQEEATDTENEEASQESTDEETTVVEGTDVEESNQEGDTTTQEATESNE
jgi:preprotein translocase SecE subunit